LNSLASPGAEREEEDMGLVDRWPLLRQLREGLDGTGAESMSAATRRLHARIRDAEVTRSICPYCGVGCGQLIHHRDGRVLSIEGDPKSPINQGTLCPKGAASRELLTHPRRLTRVRYRAAGATSWQDLDLDTAMDLIAERVWQTRKRTFVAERDGQPVRHTTGLAHLGGATLDNEENYLIKKLFTAGLGMVAVSNQARI
jgi:formate dehydrogenase major subunit